MTSRTALYLPLAVFSALAGCAVGPDYRGPPSVASESLQKPAFLRDGGAHFESTPPAARWWQSVQDPHLSELVEAAMSASPTLASAEARVRSARAQVLVSRTRYLPSGSIDAAYVRARLPTGTTSTTGSSSSSSSSSLPNPLALDLYSPVFDATWELDLFGATRRGVEGARASAASAEASFEDAQVQLAAQVAQAYVNLRAAQSHVLLAQQTIDLRTQAVALTQQRLDRGAVGKVDVDREEADLRQARAELPTAEAEVELYLDQLATLTNREPGSLDATLASLPGDTPEVPAPPALVPVGTPADWLRRRPDIREAERTLASRSAAIGQNVAAYFPTVSLLGAIGGAATTPGALLHGTPLSLISPSLSWSVLNIPRTRANVRSAEADRDQALADYRSSVLQALLDANSALERYGRDQQALVQWQQARDAAAEAAALTRQRYAAGTTSLIDSLDTERQRMAAEDQLITAESNLMLAYVSLQKSLGLGWGTAQ
jgi:NodT family efflux transporter outer membrane factor (OMF) lipoprotein